MSREEHDAGVRYFGLLPYGKCSCGWEGPTREHDTEAADDARDHLRGERQAER
jgi:hypothetical protein